MTAINEMTLEELQIEVPAASLESCNVRCYWAGDGEGGMPQVCEAADFGIGMRVTLDVSTVLTTTELASWQTMNLRVIAAARASLVTP